MTGVARRWVCFDVGEVLIDETRIWSTWADVLGIPRFTFMAAMGAAIGAGAAHQEAFTLLGVTEWRAIHPRVERAYGGFRAEDLYPDARDAVDGLRTAGYRVAVIANQPATRLAELRAIGIDAEVMAMSESLGVEKPDPAFYAAALSLMSDPSPSDVMYVGDRLDNDVGPALAAGLRAVWVRRGPWGRLIADPGNTRAVQVADLRELLERHDEVWRSS